MPTLTLLVVAVLAIGLIDLVTREDWQVKHLSRVSWMLIIILLPLVGPGLWFLLGREYDDSGFRPRRRHRATTPVSIRPPAPTVPESIPSTRSTEEQIAELEREIEEWERSRALESERTPDEVGGADSKA